MVIAWAGFWSLRDRSVMSLRLPAICCGVTAPMTGRAIMATAEVKRERMETILAVWGGSAV